VMVLKGSTKQSESGSYIGTFFAARFLCFSRFLISSINGARELGGSISLRSISQNCTKA
jgi:hypothetical protein